MQNAYKVSEEINPIAKAMEAVPPQKEQPLATEEPQNKQVPLANIFVPLIQAVVGELFQFKTRNDAMRRLERIAEQYECIQNGNNHDDFSLIMWIGGYEITTEEEKAGFAGNFARVDIKPVDDLFTLSATKLEIPLSGHPRKKNRNMRHPNWRHAVLKAAKDGLRFKSVEAGTQALLMLHQDYPDVSIPALDNRMYVYVYNKAMRKENGAPIERIVLKVVEIEETGEAVIKIKENNKNKRAGGISNKNALAGLISGGAAR